MRSHLNNLVAYLVVLAVIAAAIWFARPYWQRKIGSTETAVVVGTPVTSLNLGAPEILELSAQARANLGLKSAPVEVQSYWRTLSVPGVIEDRPGFTDRGITASFSGVVTQVHAFEGDIVKPSEKLFSIRLVSESLQQSQADLFQANREVELLNQQLGRIEGLIAKGALPGKRGLELKQQISRHSTQIEAFQQALSARGLSQERVGQIQQGEFLSEIDIVVPQVSGSKANPGANLNLQQQDFLEIQQLKVELGQQVRAGESLAVLANHFSLYIKGHAFKKEASRLAKVAEEGREVEVDFPEDSAADWSDLKQSFQIRHLANTTHPSSRTFDFFIPLQNQARRYEKEERTFVVWRFRPGQQVNILLPVQEYENVLVLPAEAVAFEGPEAFVFQQDGDLFHRLSVEVVHQDRFNVVLANDGSISPGFFLAQSSAASLNRILKSQVASGVQAGVHMHADGTVHGAH